MRHTRADARRHPGTWACVRSFAPPTLRTHLYCPVRSRPIPVAVAATAAVKPPGRGSTTTRECRDKEERERHRQPRSGHVHHWPSRGATTPRGTAPTRATGRTARTTATTGKVAANGKTRKCCETNTSRKRHNTPASFNSGWRRSRATRLASEGMRKKGTRVD
eukprot:GHVU01061710.1.p1 GENE.GHVU01061710.1~~GHVU01061710.1.p1  ORF type:complete len:163 (-),score=7.84 GHVU01061710.1:501-989(-)